MLSRSAKHLYWLARYIERTENIARMIDVNLELILDYPVDHSLNWKPLIDTLDANQYYEKKYKKYNEDNVLSFLFEGTNNSSSIKNCLDMGKYNIETVGTRKLIGCTQEELISHLEKQFTPEMNWDNYGPYFHIDHIIPCNAWDLTNDLELKACFHYTNLQPLVGPENLSKSDKYCEKEKKIHFDKVKNLILNTE